MTKLRLMQLIFAGGVSAGMLIPGAWGQEKTATVSITAGSSSSAAASASNFATHALGLPFVNRQAQWIAGKPGSVVAGAKAKNGPPTPGFYPADVSNPFNGPTVASATMHGLYVNGTQDVWGDPADFLNDLNQSTMIKITDAYVGTSTAGRYPVGNGLLLQGALPKIIYDDTILLAAFLGASYYGSGYNHIYHIYLPPGQDVCFSASPTVCYSPDNLSTFSFCAYHASVDFVGIGHVLLTVEPYQNVDGCQVQQPSPNGALVDSTADVLSHETFETITDPDGTAWWNQFSLPLFGAEIGDECQNFDFGYNFVTLNRRSYEIQPEYSTLLHACTYTPHGVGLQ